MFFNYNVKKIITTFVNKIKKTLKNMTYWILEKNNSIKIYLFIIGIFLIILTACKDKNDDNQIEQIPILTTNNATSITSTTAICTGHINYDGGFPITAKGVCWSTLPLPTISNNNTNDGTGIDDFTSTLTNLSINTKYYVRAYATNRLGAGYGNQISFTTLQGNAGTVSDIDGNVYHTVGIGTQIWMVENLKTTKYNDGTTIPLITDGTTWSNLSSPAYCWYNNDSVTYKNTYGALYNWDAIHTNKLCPLGWHIPTDSEWVVLIKHVGGDTTAGGKLKEAGITHWSVPNTGATNSTYFYALPGGYRNGNLGSFVGIKDNGFWWSSSESNASESWCRIIYFSSDDIFRENIKKTSGFSVRCLKDN